MTAFSQRHGPGPGRLGTRRIHGWNLSAPKIRINTARKRTRGSRLRPSRISERAWRLCAIAHGLFRERIFEPYQRRRATVFGSILRTSFVASAVVAAGFSAWLVAH